MNNRSQRKKVIIGINNLVVGGAQYQLLRQLRHFDSKRFEIVVISLESYDNRGTVVDEIVQYARVQQFNFSRFNDIASWWKLLRFLRVEQPDLVVSSFFFSNTVFRVLKLFCGYPIITREHNTYTNKSKMHIVVDRVLSHLSAKIVTVSKEVAEFTSAQERIDPEKFQVIENGIDLEEIERMRISIDVVEIKKTLGLQDSDKVALNVGRLVIQKDQKVLLEGFASFHSKNPNWKLLILGGGLLENDLKQLARELSIERAVIFVGEQRDVHPYYMISDCLISTSKIEGMSNTHLEALAHGLPILSTKTGGTESIVQEGENGYFIPEATEKAVEAALEKFEEADHTRMGERSRKLSHSFDITKTVKRYEELFDVYAR